MYLRFALLVKYYQLGLKFFVLKKVKKVYACIAILVMSFAYSGCGSEVPEYKLHSKVKVSYVETGEALNYWTIQAHNDYSYQTLYYQYEIVGLDASKFRNEILIPGVITIEPSTVVEFARIYELEAGTPLRVRFVGQKLTHVKPGTIHSDVKYSFPFDTEKHKQIKILGGDNEGTHNEANNAVYAVDFDLPEGSIVTAARGGTVVIVVDWFKDPCAHNLSAEKLFECVKRGNAITIRHDDGTIADYGHIAHKGAFVKEGDVVAKGSPIAKSGSVGSRSPHLHFHVRGYDEESFSDNTIPIVFEHDGKQYHKFSRGDVVP